MHSKDLFSIYQQGHVDNFYAVLNQKTAEMMKDFIFSAVNLKFVRLVMMINAEH